MGFDLTVVGGGISGLSLAALAGAAGWRVRLLEAAPALGGCIRTWRTDDGFWLELGAHSLFNSYGRLLQLLEASRATGGIRPKRRLPFRLWTGRGEVSIASQLAWPELAFSLPRLLTVRRGGRSVAEFYGRVLGRRNFKQVFGPAFDAVICQPAGAFPADRLFRRKPRSRGYPRSFSFDGGLGSMVDALAATCAEVVTGCRVEALHNSGDEFRIVTDAGDEQARRLALAVPAGEAARLLAAQFPDLAHPLQQIAAAEVESLGVVLPAAAAGLRLVGGLVGRGQPFYSVVSRDPFPDPRRRGFTFHFRPGVAGAQEKRAIAAAVLGCRPEDFEATAGQRSGLPALRPGHDALLDALERARRPELPLGLTGNWFEGLSIEDCVARSFREWARLQAI